MTDRGKEGERDRIRGMAGRDRQKKSGRNR